MSEFSKRDIARILNRPQRTVAYWADFGFVIPEIQPSQGKGITRVYSDRNLVEFGMIDVMVKDLKISLDTIQSVFIGMRENRGHDGDTVANRFWGWSHGRRYGSDHELIYYESKRSFLYRIESELAEKRGLGGQRSEVRVEKGFVFTDQSDMGALFSRVVSGEILTLTPLGKIRGDAMHRVSISDDGLFEMVSA